MPIREKGIVKWFNNVNGFGVITRQKGGDIFVDVNAVLPAESKTIMQGQAVEFIVTHGIKGPRADEVKVFD